MSALVYGAVTRKRDEAAAGDSTKTAPPGVKTYVDALAALVPAEVLVLHAFMVEVTTETKKVDGEAVTTITDPDALAATFWVCIFLAILLFFFGRMAINNRHLEKSDVLRGLIPAAAFVLWAILQKSTAWDAVSPDSLSEGSRALIGAAGALVLGGFAALLGMKLNAQGSA
jgi:hypothetical protein